MAKRKKDPALGHDPFEDMDFSDLEGSTPAADPAPPPPPKPKPFKPPVFTSKSAPDSQTNGESGKAFSIADFLSSMNKEHPPTAEPAAEGEPAADEPAADSDTPPESEESEEAAEEADDPEDDDEASLAAAEADSADTAVDEGTDPSLFEVTEPLEPLDRPATEIERPTWSEEAAPTADLPAGAPAVFPETEAGEESEESDADEETETADEDIFPSDTELQGLLDTAELALAEEHRTALEEAGVVRPDEEHDAPALLEEADTDVDFEETETPPDLTEEIAEDEADDQAQEEEAAQPAPDLSMEWNADDEAEDVPLPTWLTADVSAIKLDTGMLRPIVIGEEEQPSEPDLDVDWEEDASGEHDQLPEWLTAETSASRIDTDKLLSPQADLEEQMVGETAGETAAETAAESDQTESEKAELQAEPPPFSDVSWPLEPEEPPAEEPPFTAEAETAEEAAEEAADKESVDEHDWLQTSDDHLWHTTMLTPSEKTTQAKTVPFDPFEEPPAPEDEPPPNEAAAADAASAPLEAPSAAPSPPPVPDWIEANLNSSASAIQSDFLSEDEPSETETAEAEPTPSQSEMGLEEETVVPNDLLQDETAADEDKDAELFDFAFAAEDELLDPFASEEDPFPAADDDPPLPAWVKPEESFTLFDEQEDEEAESFTFDSNADPRVEQHDPFALALDDDEEGDDEVEEALLFVEENDEEDDEFGFDFDFYELEQDTETAEVDLEFDDAVFDLDELEEPASPTAEEVDLDDLLNAYASLPQTQGLPSEPSEQSPPEETRIDTGELDEDGLFDFDFDEFEEALGEEPPAPTPPTSAASDDPFDSFFAAQPEDETAEEIDVDALLEKYAPPVTETAADEPHEAAAASSAESGAELTALLVQIDKEMGISYGAEAEAEPQQPAPAAAQTPPAGSSPLAPPSAAPTVKTSVKTLEPTQEQTDNPRDEYVIFNIDTASYAIALDNVQEITPPPQTTYVPNVPSWVTGITNLHGEIISVIDLRRFLKLPWVESLPEQRMLAVYDSRQEIRTGFLVDKVTAIKRITPAEIDTFITLNEIPKAVQPFISGHSNEMLILNVDALLMSSEMRQFEPVR